MQHMSRCGAQKQCCCLCLKQKLSCLYASADRLGSLYHQIRNLTSGALCCNSAHHTQYVSTGTPSFVIDQNATAQVCSYQGKKSSHAY